MTITNGLSVALFFFRKEQPGKAIHQLYVPTYNTVAQQTVWAVEETKHHYSVDTIIFHNSIHHH
jgi:hypothetical protein